MKKKLTYLLFLIATVIWGLAFIAQKAATVLPAFTVGAIRSLLAAIFLFAVIPLTDIITKNGRGLKAGRGILDFNRQELIGGVVLGIIITVATAFQQHGLGSGTDAGKAAFITALYVVIVPIISTFTGKEPSPLSVISIPIAIIGFYFLCIKSASTLNTSDLLVFMCAVIFACHIIAVDKFSPKCDGVRMSFIQFASAFIFNTVLALIFEGVFGWEEIVPAIPSLLFLGILSSGVAYTLQIIGQKTVDPTIASMILSLESVFGVIGAAVFLGERMTTREYVGSAIVFVAVIMSQIEPSAIAKFRRKKKDE